MFRRPLVAALLALAACNAPPPPSPLVPVDALALYPAPRYFADAPLGVRATPVVAFDTALPPDLPPAARAAWDTAGVDRFVVIARYESGQAIVRAFGENPRAIGYATAVAHALVDGAGRLHLATVVDGSPFATRGFIEGYYGTPMDGDERRCVLDTMVLLRANLYLYGPKGDPYAHQQWADPYPPDAATDIAAAAAQARARGLDFAWAVSPGLQSGYAPPGTSISYASDADFARLTGKIDAMRALGVDRFALFLDDIDKTLVYDADRAAFATPAAAHVALANRLDAYVTAGGSPHLLFVGPYYTSKFDGWQDWASEVGATLAPGIDVMWTGPAVYPDELSADDLVAPNALFGRDVVIWNNQPRAPVALMGYSPALPTASRGFLSNTILLQEGYGYDFDDMVGIIGTLGDYAWNPAGYDPDRSLSAWGAILETANPCADSDTS